MASARGRLTNTQLKKLKSAAKNKIDATLKITKKKIWKTGTWIISNNKSKN